MCPVWNMFICTQCLCVLYEVTSLTGIIWVGLCVYVSSQSLVKSVSEGFNTSAWRKRNCRWRHISERFLEILLERLVAWSICGSDCKADFVPTVTAPQRLQSLHYLLTARDEISRTLQEASWWNYFRSSVRERGVTGGGFFLRFSSNHLQHRSIGPVCSSDSQIPLQQILKCNSHCSVLPVNT